ncbi:hypothetical protein G6011_06825 [Alternaria panax]|uniref:BZIP domain-containing protein n=1 Tax=Alternaria panax TaxID=48097 RepID=A0AAD4I8D4_9PLEO|nr:hypothetical protein G6011_06825 [Alternaria panax]
MAKGKYKTPEEKRERRRESNRKAQEKYRERVRERKQQKASPSGSTLRGERDEEAPGAVAPPNVSAPNASASNASAPNASALDASREAEHVQVEQRRPDPPNTSPTPMEYLASMEQAIDGLLSHLEDPVVRESLHDPITRIDPKFRSLVHRVQKTVKTPVQRDGRVVSKTQARPLEWNIVPSAPQRAMANATRSLYEPPCEYNTECAALTEIRRLGAQLERAMQHAVLTIT